MDLEANERRVSYEEPMLENILVSQPKDDGTAGVEDMSSGEFGKYLNSLLGRTIS